MHYSIHKKLANTAKKMVSLYRLKPKMLSNNKQS